MTQRDTVQAALSAAGKTGMTLGSLQQAVWDKHYLYPPIPSLRRIVGELRSRGYFIQTKRGVYVMGK